MGIVNTESFLIQCADIQELLIKKKKSLAFHHLTPFMFIQVFPKAANAVSYRASLGFNFALEKIIRKIKEIIIRSFCIPIKLIPNTETLCHLVAMGLDLQSLNQMLNQDKSQVLEVLKNKMTKMEYDQVPVSHLDHFFSQTNLLFYYEMAGGTFREKDVFLSFVECRKSWKLKIEEELKILSKEAFVNIDFFKKNNPLAYEEFVKSYQKELDQLLCRCMERFTLTFLRKLKKNFLKE